MQFQVQAGSAVSSPLPSQERCIHWDRREIEEDERHDEVDFTPDFGFA
jgi:hypothetical protein